MSIARKCFTIRNGYIGLFLLGGLLFSSLGFGHALWIETPPSGLVNKPHIVHIFYGEFAEQEKDHPQKWYSDVRDFTLFLIDESGTMESLKVSADSLGYTSSFTPSKAGLYKLYISKAAKDVGGTTLYHFTATAFVQVSLPSLSKKSSSATIAPTSTPTTSPLKSIKSFVPSKDPGIFELDYSLTRVSPNENLADGSNNSSKQTDKAKNQSQFNPTFSVAIQVVKNKAIAPKTKVVVTAPNGWSKELYADEKGLVQFQPIWKGTYMVEVMDTRKEMGSSAGKPFEQVWEGATLSIPIL